MQNDPNNLQAVYLQNLAVSATLLTLADATLAKVLGSEATSTSLNGEPQTRRDIQELLASRVLRNVGI